MYERNRSFLDELPTTAYVLAFCLLLLGVGFGLDRLGYYVESGIVAALAVVVIAIVVLAQALLWTLAKFD